MKQFSNLHIIGLILTTLMAQQSIIERLSNKKTSIDQVSPLIGLYEEHNEAKPIYGINASHAFFSVGNKTTPSSLKKFLAETSKARTMPMITLEPFPKERKLSHTKDIDYMIKSGQYDKELREIFSTLKNENKKILVRFAHEMDVNNLYPWSYSNGGRYVAMYKYVYTLAKEMHANNLVWVWSPQGRDNADHYWPGSDQVDLIGVSIYASRAFTGNHKLESFESILGERSWLGRRYRKQLVAAEIGVSGNEEEQNGWLKSAFQYLKQHHAVVGFFYFQARQPSFMPLETGQEDWRLKTSGLKLLSKNAKEFQQ